MVRTQNPLWCFGNRRNPIISHGFGRTASGTCTFIHATPSNTTCPARVSKCSPQRCPGHWKGA